MLLLCKLVKKRELQKQAQALLKHFRAYNSLLNLMIAQNAMASDIMQAQVIRLQVFEHYNDTLRELQAL